MKTMRWAMVAVVVALLPCGVVRGEVEAAADRAAVEAAALWERGFRKRYERYTAMESDLRNQARLLRTRIEVAETPPTPERIEHARTGVVDHEVRIATSRVALERAIAEGNTQAIDAAYHGLVTARLAASRAPGPWEDYLVAVEQPAQPHEIDAFEELIESSERAADSLGAVFAFRQRMAQLHLPDDVEQAHERLQGLLERVMRVPDSDEYEWIERRSVRPGRAPGGWVVEWFANDPYALAFADVSVRSLDYRMPYDSFLLDGVPISRAGLSDSSISFLAGNFNVTLRFTRHLPKGEDVMRRAAVELIDVEALRALTVETRPELLDAAQE